MTTLLRALPLFAPALLVAATPPLPACDENKIGLVPLTLDAQAKTASSESAAAPVPTILKRVPLPPSRKLVSHMPLLEPRTDFDLKMRIVRPDEKVHHALIVKTPDLESSNSAAD